jgi:hypothetical protein
VNNEDIDFLNELFKEMIDFCHIIINVDLLTNHDMQKDRLNVNCSYNINLNSN